MSVTLDLESRKVEAAVNDILDLLKEHSGIKLTSEQSIPVVNDDDDGQSRDNNLFYHLHDMYISMLFVTYESYLLMRLQFNFFTENEGN